MVNLVQILPGDAEPSPHEKTVIHKVTQMVTNGHKRCIFTSVYYEIPNFCVPRMVSHPWIWLQIVSDGQIMLCRKNSAIFLSSAPITLVNMCTGYKWGSGITPKNPSGGHASLGMTQQSQSLTLIGPNSSTYFEAEQSRTHVKWCN